MNARRGERTRSESGRSIVLDVVLADGRALHARAGYDGGQALASWLAQHTSYLNLTDVHEGERHWEHMAVSSRQIVLAGARGAGVLHAAHPEGRRVEIRLLTGSSLVGRLPLLHRQRIGDYIRARGAFLEIADAEVRPRADARITLAYADLAIGSRWIVSVVETGVED